MRKKESKLHNKTLTSLFVAIWNRSKNRCGIVVCLHIQLKLVYPSIYRPTKFDPRDLV